MTRRQAGRYLLTLAGAGFGLSRTAPRLLAQTAGNSPRPDSFKVYSDAPRLLLRPARLKLLRRERERRSLRWDQFETLWTAGANFPDAAFVQALRFQLTDDREAATRAVAWAAGPGEDIRQLALVADWCAPVISKDDRALIFDKLRREVTSAKPVTTMTEARNRVFAATVLSETQPQASEKAIQAVFDGFWLGTLIPQLRAAKGTVSNADAYPMLELLHAFRDGLDFDLRDTFPKYFEQYPLLHLMAHYPAPWPAAENEFRIPADEAIAQRGPDLGKATFSRLAELAMVAYDTNAASTQLLQGWLMNDRFLLRGAAGIAYELLWANPYQPGLSYHHVPLAFHDEIGGQLFVRSSWEDDAVWAGFFNGHLQVFEDGGVSEIDPRKVRDPLDLGSAVVFFARETKKFISPDAKDDAGPDPAVNVFLVGLEPGRAYHVEIDGEGMVEEIADAGGIVYLSGVPTALGVRLAPRTVTA